MAGELLPIGTRPKLLASFDPPGAEARFREWQKEHSETLAGIPGEAWRVEYGRTGAGAYVRVRIDEEHVPEALKGP